MKFLLAIKLASAIALLTASVAAAQTNGTGSITEFPITYPKQSHTAMSHAGSTHEITYDAAGGNALWLTGQNYDTLVKVDMNGKMTQYAMPAGSGPHGIEFDAASRLWVSLEFSGKIVQIDPNGKIKAEYDVRLDCSTCAEKINTHPHGLGIGSDGKTIWYTGKATNTIGKISFDARNIAKIQTFALRNVGSVPIYIKAGPDGNMWVTELVGNAIARITPDGTVTEFPIPTPNSRPIAIVPEPGGQAMWFSEEAGNKVGRIDMNGTITEFAVPKAQNNVILAGLAFDSAKNLWVQQYVDANNAAPAGRDYIIKIDKAILKANPSDMSSVPVTFYQVPTTNTVMHRIVQAPDGNMWFTEMHANTLGRLITGLTPPTN